jgi:hypothetical protein
MGEMHAGGASAVGELLALTVEVDQLEVAALIQDPVAVKKIKYRVYREVEFCLPYSEGWAEDAMELSLVDMRISPEWEQMAWETETGLLLQIPRGLNPGPAGCPKRPALGDVRVFPGAVRDSRGPWNFRERTSAGTETA